jgi:fatty-acyl-CoA synthase
MYDMEKLLDITLGTALRERAAKHGRKEFFIYPNLGLRYTFGEIDKKADALAKGLLAAGFRKGDHVGIWANNVPGWPLIFYAASRVGIVVVPININCKHKEIAYILDQADIKGLFIIDKFRDVDLADILYQLIPELRDSPAGCLQSEQFPCLKMVAKLDNIPRQGMYIPEDIVKLGSQIDDISLKKAEMEVGNTDILTIMYTSGTTGNPKGAMLTHRNIINTGYLANRLGKISENDVILNPLPLFYITALTGVIIEGLLYGFKAVMLEKFDPLRCLEVIQQEKCTWIYAVPAMYMAMLAQPQFNEFSMESVQYCCIGGDSCSPALMQAIMGKMKARGIYLAYGLTETSPFITDVIIEEVADPRLATVGVPFPGVEVSIRNLENNTECPVNEQGEICTKGYHVMKGYYKMKTASHEVIDEGGWFHTGDLGHLLPNGCLVVDGRIKEMIVRGGEKIYPREIENLLLAMPGIQNVQAVGIPSEKYGEEVGVFIIPKPEVVINEKDIVDFCKNKISFYKTPKYVFFADSFPISANGKVQKFKLSELGLKQVQEKGISTA